MQNSGDNVPVALRSSRKKNNMAIPRGPGNCTMNRHHCLDETACVNEIIDGKPVGYSCLCYATKQHPEISDDGHWHCSRNVVTHIPQPHNLSIGTGELNGEDIKVNVLQRGKLNPLGWESSSSLTIMILAFCLLSAILTTFICFLKRKSLQRLLQKNQQSKFELDMKSGRLLPDRFIANPTYESANVDLSIRIFSPDEIKMMTQIGHGCFGNVFRGELNGEAIAVKVVKPEHSGEAMKEVETMASFNHHNILQMTGIAKNADMDAPWLLFEFMEYGDLASVLRSNASSSIQDNPEAQQLPLRHDDLLDFAYQISEGMKYLSSQHFVHRDLAARNCLVGNYGVVKISDFGLSRDVYTCDYYKIGGSRLLPVRWMSPESVLYGRFTLESDVWAYGVLLWEIYSWGKQPFFGHSNEEVVQLILDGVLLCPPTDCPLLICQMMAGCWKSEPKDRLKFPAICEKFIKSCKEKGGDAEEVRDDEQIEMEESQYEIPIKANKPCCTYVEVL